MYLLPMGRGLRVYTLSMPTGSRRRKLGTLLAAANAPPSRVPPRELVCDPLVEGLWGVAPSPCVCVAVAVGSSAANT